jgi:hypothetical protein
LPLIATGCAGVSTVVTPRLRAVLEPQILFAVTEIAPEDVEENRLMPEVDELPVHPVG